MASETERKWTPGPWVAGADGKHRAWIADLHNGVAVWTERRFGAGEALAWGERDADANLIAAAPDMYAALKDIERCSAIPEEWLEPVRAALAKASGERVS